MAKKDGLFYRQCELRRVSGHLEVAWIPEEFARKGKYLRIKRGEKWENGWEVVAVYDRASAEQVEKNERLYLVQREASDI